MKLAELLATYRDGDEHGWQQEFSLLREIHPEELAVLRDDIAARGIQMPVLLGPDGRVWDGHHRLCVAYELGLVDIPVEFA